MTTFRPMRPVAVESGINPLSKVVGTGAMKVDPAMAPAFPVKETSVNLSSPPAAGDAQPPVRRV